MVSLFHSILFYSIQLVVEISRDEQSAIPEQPPPIYLYDTENNPVDAVTKNKNAWGENYTFMLNEQTFRVRVNLPSVEKMSLPKLMLTGMPSVVKIECENIDEIERNSMFIWYASETSFAAAVADEVVEPPAAAAAADVIKKSTSTASVVSVVGEKKKPKALDLSNVKWQLIDQGKAKRMLILDANLVNRLVRVECVPSDGNREGLAVEAISSNSVRLGPEIDKMPMSTRHALTATRLDSEL